MNIEEIKHKTKLGLYEISVHAEKERYAEDISLEDIETAISNSILLEDYTNDPRGPSCLLLGSSEGRPIHIVCGYSPVDWVRIITVYLPKLPKWIDEQTRA
ncbi:MAG: DUF4258 domain-containing protein [Bacteroidetes bacterium]|nr:MAG: DUF4258 domain-containing protein [Bacteroidota bacterium]